MREKIKIRRYWGINPKTKIVESKKKYNRQLTKREVQKIREEDDY